ncbi:hypothetical protein JCM15457_597 [Liquorilactobacillus sucicola DSM 21376 = JCM 15457]|uniref:Pyrimidine dimer DNA glycosylase n=1 Tax=Liquorilactobacillus sucicola DSM 21376 = JCM 15457 TaxID=1423806 RepID=A0A023CVA4_9LACO|nr:TIGR02328 family protein [Liquorilactobacillus sucicola]KRN05633.1 hypothetical protein FD15_GL002196 [Liquorilactobacillus sucicola DSM 21376 = JCM 15457]GAJ25719.1 hypothetical protein JCM15457_597 [Liquorilactobacillus sucicola DSM 21376 = JCM 15457]
MRLWHQQLIPLLPRQQLLGQHREIAALRGNGWGRPHATVNYVFRHSPYKLFQFHLLVLEEMEKRGYHPAANWRSPTYRGLHCAPYTEIAAIELSNPIYPEHDAAYLRECLQNLKTKGVVFANSVLQSDNS